MSLLRKQLSLLPIVNSMDLNVYIKGMKIRTVEDITTGNYTKICSKSFDNTSAGTKMVMRYEDKSLSFSEIHLCLDIIKDKVKNEQLDKKYLTDLDKQASLISKFCKGICSVAQLKRYYIQQHPIKTRLKRIKSTLWYL